MPVRDFVRMGLSASVELPTESYRSFGAGADKTWEKVTHSNRHVNRKLWLGAALWLMVIGLSIASTSAAFTTVVGEQSGDWSANGSPFVVIGDILVPEGEHLTIQQGVDIVFRGLFYFTVEGRLTAVGGDDLGQRIRFMGEDSLMWQGIFFEPPSDDRSIISGCEIINAFIGIDLNHASPTAISRNTIFAHNTGINCVASSPNITGNELIRVGGLSSQTTATGINLVAGSNARIEGNHRIHVVGNSLTDAAGISVEHSFPYIRANLIEVMCTGIANGIVARRLVKLDIIQNIIRVRSLRQMTGARILDATNVTMRNNTMVLLESSIDATGLRIGGGSNVTLINNIVHGNGTSAGLIAADSVISRGSDYNDFWAHSYIHNGNWEGFIAEDPLFVNPTPNDYARPQDYELMAFRDNEGRLWWSPCIDAGDPNYRDPDGTRSDIGRFYVHQNQNRAPELIAPSSFTVLDLYPNPFNAWAKVQFTFASAQHAELHISDVSGRNVAQLWAGHLASGHHTFTWQAAGVSAGVYFVHLKTSDGVKTAAIVFTP